MKLFLATAIIASVSAASSSYEKIMKSSQVMDKTVKHAEAASAGRRRTSHRRMDEACTTAYDDASNDILLGTACEPVNGACPDSCQAAFDDLNDVCEGKTYTDVDGIEQDYDHAITVVALGLFLDEICSDVVDAGDAGTTCEGLYTAVTGELVFGGDACDEAEDGTCPETCFELFKDLHEACDGQKFEGDDGEMIDYDAEETIDGFKLVALEGACKDADLLSAATSDAPAPASMLFAGLTAVAALGMAHWF